MNIYMTGDMLGRVVGVALNKDNTPAPEANITAILLPKSLNRSVTTRADKDGVFIIDYRTLASGVHPSHISVTCSAENSTGNKVIPVSDINLSLVPQPEDPDSIISLSGEWQFTPDPPEDFYAKDFDERSLAKIKAPGHWVMSGFESKQGIGGYRRWVSIPKSWQGKRIRIAFDGVHTGAEVWVNGVRAGYHDGGSTPFQFDITEAAHPGKSNLISVRVTEHTPSSLIDAMSYYAHFPLAGIYRNVSLFAVPEVHLTRFHAETNLDNEYNNAVLKVYLTLTNETSQAMKDSRVTVVLRPPNDRRKTIAEKSITLDMGPWDTRSSVIEIPVSKPQKWDPEHPVLYELTASVDAPGQPKYITKRRIGFRKVEIRDSKLLVNGVGIKLKGANRHDAHPHMGRAIPPDVAKQDLELMKSCNMNGFRTSHYPPIPEVLDLADEMGFGVEDEAAVCFVGAPWGPKPPNGGNPAKEIRYLPVILRQVAEMVERDRSHPSVLWWSVCNESDWGAPMEWVKKWLREADPTRPVTAGGFAQLDITMAHNPTLLKDIKEHKRFGTPVLGEEAIAIFQGFQENGPEIDLDPGMRDLWVKPFIPIWEEVLQSPWYVGLFTWAWVDDVFLVPGAGYECGRYALRKQDFEMAQYHKPDRGTVGEPPWGIIDGWRRPRPEWYLHKKLFSPVHIKEQPLKSPASDGVLEIEIENRFDYTNISEIKCFWTIGKLNGTVNCDIAPRSRGIARITLPPDTPVTGDTVYLSFEDAKRRVIDEYKLPIGSAPTQMEPLKNAAVPDVREEQTTLAGTLIRIIGENFEIGFDRDSGRLWRGLGKGRQVLIDWPVLHLLPAANAFSSIPDDSTWSLKKIDVSKKTDTVEVVVDGSYRDFEGTYVMNVSFNGEIRTDYKFVYNGPDLSVREIGLRMTLPRWCDTLQWDRNAEWSVYPDDHIGRPVGGAKALSSIDCTVPPTCSWNLDNSPMGCNDFRSTKRNINKVSLADKDGFGVQVVSDGSQSTRACMSRSGMDLHILDYYGGTRSTAVSDVWEKNYGTGKALSKGDIVQGSAAIRILAGNP